MAVQSIIQQIVQHLQFFAMLGALDIDWPFEWTWLTGWLSWFNIEPEYIIGQQSIPALTFRLFFILISICLPLLINLLLLLIFQPIYVVLWYFSMCFGAIALVVGMAGYFLPDAGVEGAQSQALTYIILGGSVLFLGALVGGIFFLINWYKNKDKEEAEKHLEDVGYWERFHRLRFVQHCVAFIFFLVAGLLMMRVFTLSAPDVDSTDKTFAGLAFFIIGCILVGIAAITFIFMIICLFKPGRKFVVALTQFVKSHLLMVMLLLISISYIPVLSFCIQMFMCADYSCPQDHVFNPYVERAPNSYDTSSGRFCDRCSFSGGTGSYCSQLNSTALCAPFQDSRSWRNPETPCGDEATVYFMVSAAIVLACYAFGIPLLYYMVIGYLTDRIDENAKVLPQMEGETEEDFWARKMYAVQPAAASLYEPFRRERRYYSLFTMVHRLLITLALNVAAAFSSAAAVLVLLFHGMAGFTVFYFRPYLSIVEQFLAIALAIANVLNGIYAIVVWREGKGVPASVTGAFIFLNAVVPVVGTLIAKVLQIKAAKKAEKREKRFMEKLRLYARAQRLRDEGKDAEAELVDAEMMRKFGSTEPYNVEDDEDWSYETTPAETDGVPSPPPEPQQAPSANATVETPRKTGSRPVTPQPQSNVVRNWSVETEKRDPKELPVGAIVLNEDSEDELAEDEHWEYMTDDGEGEADPEKKRRKKANKILRETFDGHSTTTMNKAFMIMGVFFLIALGIAFLGTLREAQQQFLIGSSPLRYNTENQLADYGSWEEFTSECCCTAQDTINIDFNTTERWVCRNGRVVNRGRVTKNLAHNSLAIRPLCSSTFLTGCRIVIREGAGHLECGETQKAALVPTNVSERAYTYYW